MAQIQTKWIADDAVNDLKVKLRNNQGLRARNFADTADIEIIKLLDDDSVELPAGTLIDGTQIATLSDIPTTFNIQGNWNANTNTPTLASGVNPIDPLEYPLYIVEVGGSTTLDGYSDWVVGDKLYFANGQWYKVDNNDAVASVNGQTGVVSLDSDDISEGTTNLYFTDGRAQTAAVVNSTAGSETVQAPSVASMKSYVAGEISAITSEFLTYKAAITLTSTDITNKFVQIPQKLDISGGTPGSNYHFSIRNAPTIADGSDYSFNFTTGEFDWDTLALDGILAAGDILVVHAYGNSSVAY
jgi:hypothetical protein